MKPFTFAVLLSCLSLPAITLAQESAQPVSDSTPLTHSFIVKDGSKLYDATLSVATCDDDICNGKGTIELTDKRTGAAVQTFHSDDLYFFLTAEQTPTVNVIQLYDEQSPLIFDDFNFDGSEDLAIRNGNQSGYGGPSYDVYVFNRSKNRFVLSEDLTELAYENLGMFQTNHQLQTHHHLLPNPAAAGTKPPSMQSYPSVV